MSTALYFIGFLVLIAGLAWGATALGVPTLWVTIGAIVVAGLAIISIAGNVQKTEPRHIEKHTTTEAHRTDAGAAEHHTAESRDSRTV